MSEKSEVLFSSKCIPWAAYVAAHMQGEDVTFKAEETDSIEAATLSLPLLRGNFTVALHFLKEEMTAQHMEIIVSTSLLLTFLSVII